MGKYIDRNSYQHNWLKRLGYRADPDLIAMCVNRLRMGEKPYRLYGKKSPDKIVSQDLGTKIGRDYKDRKLDFIEDFDPNESERARHDPFRYTRFDIVNEAEGLTTTTMPPHYSLWNLDHLDKICDSNEEAEELLLEYDRIKPTRIEAESAVSGVHFRDNNGKMVMIESKPIPTMRDFHDLPKYLRMHYLVYYLTAYPDAPKEWAVKASEARAEGKLDEDEKLIVSTDNIHRYKVWDQKRLDSYFKSLARFSKTKDDHTKLKEDLRKRFGLAFSDSELKD